MKLKYYLRGLGIGILITGLIMGVSQKNAVASARAEVMRAYAQNTLKDDEPSETLPSAETGTEPVLVRDDMPEDNNESEINRNDVTGEDNGPEDLDLSGEDLQQSNPDALPQADDSGGSPADEADEPEDVSPESISSATPEEPSEAVVIVNPGAAALDAQTITITISKGDDSGTVSRKLYNAGLIGSASEYDAFLMQHGYDKRINTGEKVISMNDSWQEIAEKITH